MVVMITMNEKPMADVVIREAELSSWIERNIMMRHNTLPNRLNMNAILTFFNSSL